MALPFSTIAMAVGTCLAFTLAIRDTVADKRRVSAADAKARDLAEETYREAIEEANEREVRAEQAREAELARSREVASALHTVYNNTPASLGAAFLATPLGSSAGSASDQRDATAALREASLEVRFDGERELQRLVITPVAHLVRDARLELCEMLRMQLLDRWGAGDNFVGGRYWFDEASGQRAMLGHDSRCELRFDRYATVERWLGRARNSVVPVWAYGRPPRELVEHLETVRTVEGLFHDEREVSWTDVGVAAGTGRTTVTADVRNGRIVAISAGVRAEAITKHAVSEHATATLGRPPPIDIVTDQPYLSVEIGTPPSDSIGPRAQED